MFRLISKLLRLLIGVIMLPFTLAAKALAALGVLLLLLLAIFLCLIPLLVLAAAGA